MTQLNDFNTSKMTNGFVPSNYFADVANQNKNILRGYIAEVENLEEVSIDGLVAYQDQVIATSQGRTIGYFKTLGNILGNIAVAAAVELGIYAVNKFAENLEFTPQHKEKIAKLAKDAQSSFDEGLNENQNNQAAVQEMADSFKQLSKGVSSTGENLYLTNNQYETYKSYVEKLIEINPSLVKGINEQKNAFIDNADAIDSTIKSLKEQQRLMYADFFNGKDNLATLEYLNNEYKKTSDAIFEVGEQQGQDNTNSLSKNLKYLKGNLEQLQKMYEKEGNSTADIVGGLLEKSGLNGDIANNYQEIAENINRLQPEYEQLLKQIPSNTGILFRETSKNIQKNLSNNEELLIQYSQLQSEMESLRADYDDYVDRYAHSLEGYSDLSAQQLTMVDQFIQGYDFWDKMSDAKGDSGRREAERQMKADTKRFISFLTRLSEDTNSNISSFMALDKSQISYEEYRAKANKLIQDVMSDPNYDEKLLSEQDLKISLGISFETDDGQIKNSYEDMLQNVVNRFGAKVKLDPTLENKIRGLSLNQLTKLFNTEDFSKFDTWSAVENFLNNAQEFDIKSYQDTIDDIIKDLDKLGEANAKLINGDLTPNADGAVKYVMELAKEFPELNKYIDYGAENFGNLGKGIEDVIQHRPDSLLKMWDSLGNLTDSARRDVDNYRKAIKKLQEDAMGGDLTWISRLGLTEQDYLNYVVKDYDKIIKRLQDEKDGLSDVNDELTEQKEKLDKIVDEYKIAGDTVIKQLDDKISDVNDYYDEQIDKLKTENEELERSLELQQKQAALANAQKRKVRVLTETEGWVWKNDNQGIRNAEKDLKDTETNIRVAELEKQRDDEIKLWEDYKDAWQDAMDAYTKAHDEAITDGILGSGWRDNVMARDEDMLNNYEVSYSNFQYRLNDDIGKQIEANNEYEKSIDKKIKKYEDDKKAIQDWVDEQEESNDRYFGLLDEVKVTENSTWNERLANFEEFKNNFLAIKAQLENEDISKMYAVEFNGKTAGFYNSESEARAAAKSLVNAKVNYATANNPSARTSSNIAHLRDEAERLIRILAPGSYSNGGVIDYTGVANVHGSPNKSEVALNSSQAGEVYSFIKSGMLSKATDAMTAAYNSLIDLLPKPKLGNLINPMLNLPRGTGNVVESKPLETSNEINISFAGATINAESYESFKDYMDRYTGDLFLQLQTGKK